MCSEAKWIRRPCSWAMFLFFTQMQSREPKIEIIEEEVSSDKPNFNDIFKDVLNKTEPVVVQDVLEEKQPRESVPEKKAKTKATVAKKPPSRSWSSIIIYTLCAVTLAIIVATIIYFFVSSRRMKVEVLRLENECDSYRKLVHEKTSQADDLAQAKETYEEELSRMHDEVQRLNNELTMQRHAAAIRQQSSPAPSTNLQKRKQHTRASIPQPTGERPKIELVENDSDEESSDNEYTVKVPMYEGAPPTEKPHKKPSPQQQLKNVINGQASQKFQKKVAAINQVNEVPDTYEDEQREISAQLGLNKNNINVDKLNDVAKRIEHAVDEEADEDVIPQPEQIAVDADDLTNLIAYEE